MKARALLAPMLATFTWLAPARAEPHASPPPSPPAQEATGEWGWLVVGSGLLVGGALTGVGLTFECEETARACQREASIMIWGGIGIAGLASAIGIAIVQAGRARVQVAPQASGFALRGSF